MPNKYHQAQHVAVHTRQVREAVLTSLVVGMCILTSLVVGMCILSNISSSSTEILR